MTFAEEKKIIDNILDTGIDINEVKKNIDSLSLEDLDSLSNLENVGMDVFQDDDFYKKLKPEQKERFNVIFTKIENRIDVMIEEDKYEFESSAHEIDNLLKEVDDLKGTVGDLVQSHKSAIEKAVPEIIIDARSSGEDR